MEFVRICYCINGLTSRNALTNIRGVLHPSGSFSMQSHPQSRSIAHWLPWKPAGVWGCTFGDLGTQGY